MKRPLLLLPLALGLAACVATPLESDFRPGAPSSCDYPSLPGREFVFRDADAALQNIDYHPWKKAPDGSDKQQPYLYPAGEKAKLAPRLLAGRNHSSWFQATTERCRTIYAQREKTEALAPTDPWQELPDAYFLDTYREAEAKVGRTIWSKPASKGLERFDTRDPKVSYPKTNLEPLTIVGLDPTEYSHTHGSNRPFFLVVRKATGEEALLPYDQRYFHESDPLDPAWSPELVAKIKAQELLVGMSASQVVLAWGKPKKIKPLATGGGQEEQWLFDSGAVLTFRQGLLLNSQGKVKE